MNAPDLLAALATGLAKDENEWRRDRLHVTDLSVAIDGEDGGCPRALWLRLHGAAETPLTTGQALMFDHSHAIHERIIPLLQKGLVGTGWRLEHTELSLVGLLPEGVDAGRMDSALRHESGRVLVYDTKTIRGKAFGYLNQPKPAHTLQVQTYAMAYDADGGLLFYVDREGQNAARQFYVERDDATVLAAVAKAKAVRELPEAPPILSPKVAIRENKGPDAVYLESGWRCDYCRLRSTSCPGALPAHLRELGIVAKRAKDGTLSPTLDSDAGREAFGLVVQMLGVQPTELEQVLFTK